MEGRLSPTLFNSSINNTNSSFYSNVSLTEEQIGDYVTLPWYTTLMRCIFSFVVVGINVPAVYILAFTKLKSKNLDLISLGIVDALVGFAVFVSIFDAATTFVSFRWCLLRYTIFSVAYTNSMSHILMICVNRLLLVTRKRGIFNTGKEFTKVVGLTFGITTLLVVAPALTFTLDKDYDVMLHKCRMVDVFKHPDSSVYIGCLWTTLEVAVAVCYGYIIQHLRSHFAKMRKLKISNQNCERERERLKRERRSITTLGLIVLVFVICVSPSHICLVLEGFGVQIPCGTAARDIFYMCACLNSAINPVLYLHRLPEVKTYLRSSTVCVASSPK